VNPELETVCVSTPLEYAQAALLLGEQRAWTEALVGHDLADIQPSSRHEYAHLADFYAPPDGAMLLARLEGDPVGVVAVRRLDDERGEGKRLFVRPPARGSGVARRLLVEMFALAARSASSRFTSRRRRARWPSSTSGIAGSASARRASSTSPTWTASWPWSCRSKEPLDVGHVPEPMTCARELRGLPVR
jgi:GNAT superfamily N-acetyltransferase